MNISNERQKSFSLLVMSAFVFLCCLPATVWGKWYMLTGSQANSVYVVDTETDKVVKTIPLEGRGPIFSVTPNLARPQFAYVVNDLNQSVVVVDLDEGKEVVRFPLSNGDELVRTMATDVNTQGTRLYIHEMPLKMSLGRYEMQDTRIRVIDLTTNKVMKVFPAPRQIMSLATSPDGKRLYGFSIGGDISVFDPEKGTVLDTIPMAHNWKVSGMGRVDGLPLWNPYQESDYVAAFAVVTNDTITGNNTLGLAYLDLKQESPNLQLIELQPYAAEWWTAQGVMSLKTQKAYFGWDKLWKVDLKTRNIEKVASFDTSSHFGCFLHPEGKKVYCGANWSTISVFNADTLEPLGKIDLKQSQAGAGMRFVQNPRGF
jgi:YVTN family beta-propeller protein